MQNFEDGIMKFSDILYDAFAPYLFNYTEANVLFNLYEAAMALPDEQWVEWGQWLEQDPPMTVEARKEVIWEWLRDIMEAQREDEYLREG